jgi:uncharacterized protein YndB with AHSA1/START domain
MTNTIRREIMVPQSREVVWRAITDSATLAEWMFPNDFIPQIGHRFNFHVPPNPQVGFDGLVVQCEVLECEPPRGTEGGRLSFSWSAAELSDTQVSFRLESVADGTRIHFEHAGFDLTLPFGQQAFHGAEFGWAAMLKKLKGVVKALSDAGM